MWWEAAQPNKAALPLPGSPAPWNGSGSSIASQKVSGCFSELARLTALQRCLHLRTGMCELWGYIVKDHCNNLFVPHVCICSHVLEDLHTLGRVPHCCKLLTHMQPLFLDMLILPLTSFLCFIIDRDISSSIYIYIYSLFVHNFMSYVSPCVGHTLIFLLLYMKTSMFKEIILHNQ